MNTTNLIIAGLAFMAGKTLSEGAPAAAPVQAGTQPGAMPRTVALDAHLDDVTYRAVVNCYRLAKAPDQLEQLAVAVAQFPIASLLLQRRAQEMRAVQAQAAPAVQPAPAQAAASAAKPKPNPNADVSTGLLKMLSDMTPELYEAQAGMWEPEQRREIEALMLSKGLNPPKAKPKAPPPELPEAKPNGLAQDFSAQAVAHVVMPQPVPAHKEETKS